MKCALCNHDHFAWMPCIEEEPSIQDVYSSLLPKPNFDFLNKPDPILPSYVPSYEPPKPNFDFLNKPDPIISSYVPSYEPPKSNFDFLNKPAPIIPSYVPSYELPKPNFDFLNKPDPILPSYVPSYEPPKPNFDFLNKPDPIIPSYEPPKPIYDLFPKVDPVLPPPSPVYDIGHNTIGWKPELENRIYTGLGGSNLDIGPGGFVRDPIGNLVGQMGPMNTLMPPSLPQMPDYGPPQSTPDAWAPGYSPMGPPG